MAGFMFATLGSIVFWVVYLGVGAFVATIVLKHIAKETFSFLIGGCEHYTRTKCSAWIHPYVGYILIAMINLAFWPAILFGIVAFFVMAKIIPLAVRKTVISIDKMVPEIKFGKQE